MTVENGLVFACILDGKGGGTEVDWQGIKEWTPEQGVLWTHLDHEDPYARKWLEEDSGIDSLVCEALLAEETRPRSVAHHDGLMVILRGVNLNPGADPEDMVSLRLWFEAGRILSLRHRKVAAIVDIRSSIESGEGPENAGAFLAMISDLLTSRMSLVIADLDDAVDELEEELLTAESYEMRTRIGSLRRQAIALRRYIAPQRDVMNRLQNERVSWLSDIDHQRLREIADRVTRYVEDLDSARDRASVTQEELNSRLSESMNRTMYSLSIVAGIFLPLGLLTGLLGINVGGIPGTESKGAFALVCIGLVLIGVGQAWYFKRKRFF